MTSPEFPNPCNRCGFCCLAQPCPVEKLVFGPRKPGEQCPALSFEGDIASCAMVDIAGRETMGIGKGCCINAKASIGKQIYDFASMPDELKILATRAARRNPAIMVDAKPN